MNRRGFLGSILALVAPPAIVRADALMRIVPRGPIATIDFEWRETYDQMISRVMRENRHLIIANVMARNSALRAFARHKNGSIQV